jgi:metal transporter CNNM
MAPAPKARVPKGYIVTDPDNPAIPEDNLVEVDEVDGSEGKQRDRIGSFGSKGPGLTTLGSSPKTTFIMRRSSGAQDGINNAPIAVRGNANDMREHLKHLGPSNLASHPKSTRYNTVKIKRGNTQAGSDALGHQSSIAEERYRDNPGPEGGEGEGLLKSAGKEASDGVQAVQRGYGSTENRSSQSPGSYQRSGHATLDGASGNKGSSSYLLSANQGDSDDSDTMGCLPSRSSSPLPRKRNPARSGSITENIVDAGGVRKVVLETNSSSDDPDFESKHDSVSYSKNHSQNSLNGHSEDKSGNGDAAQAEYVKKKNKRRRKRKGATKGENPAMSGGSGH